MPPAAFHLKKRPSTASSKSPKASPSARLRVSQLSPKAAPRHATSTLPPTADIEVSILPYAASAQDVASSLPTEPLWQVQVQHTAKPSVLSKLLNSFTAFLTHLRGTNDEVPETIQELKTENGIIITLSGLDDPLEVGWIQWRVAFYVVGDISALKEAVMMLLAFFDHRRQHADDASAPFPAKLHIQLRCTDAIKAGLPLDAAATPHELVINTPPCFGAFEAAPPFGKTVLILQAEFEHATIAGIFRGNTYPYRAAFEAASIYGTKLESSGEYVRVLQPVNVEEERGRVWVLNDLLHNILRASAVQVRIVQPPPQDSPAADLVSLLREQPQVQIQDP